MSRTVPTAEGIWEPRARLDTRPRVESAQADMLLDLGADVTAWEAPGDLAEGEEPAPVVDQRDRIRNQLFQQRIASYADSYLEELRADAIIVEN